MRISQTKAVGATKSKSKAVRSSNGGAVFSLEPSSGPSQTAPSTHVASSLPIGDISALLAVQGDERQRARADAVVRGHETLDALDALKVDVLSGQVTRQKLVHLATLAENQRKNLGDPGLMNILDHIELRARVELAKFEKRQG